MSATQAATSAAVGGSECRCRSCRRTEPMSMESAASGAAAPRISSVEPPPMSIDQHRERRRRDRRLRTAPSKDSAASTVARDDLGLDAEPLAHAGHEDVGVRRVPARPRSRTNRTRSGGTSWARISSAYSSIAANARTSASSAIRPVRSRSWPSRTIRISRTSTSGRSPISSLIVLVPQSMAATAHTHGPDSHHVAEQVEHLVAERVHAAALASDWPASTCRHLTRSGMPPAEMPSISGTLCPTCWPSSARAAR